MRFILLAMFLAVDLTLIGSHKRDKRYLVYSLNGSKLQLIFGTGVPIHLEDISATVGWVIKSAYLMPTNASIYTDPYGELNGLRRERSTPKGTSRYQLYSSFEKNILGFHPAKKDCLLRTICETSRIPLKGRKLIGQILKLFLSPSSTDEVAKSAEEEEYHLAEARGKIKDADCLSFYPSCSLDLTSILSVTF